MTINLALLTAEAVILGCDSISSQTQPMVNPLTVIERDAKGDFVTDEQGRFKATFDNSAIFQQVTNAWGGVQKMFCLSDGARGGAHVAGVTAGLATLNQRAMGSYASGFRAAETMRPDVALTVKEIVRRFFEFMTNQFRQHYGDDVPPSFRSEVEFLVGGFGPDDDFPSLYRIRLNSQTNEVVFEGERRSVPGIAWAGQSTSMHRMLSGIDAGLVSEIERAVQRLYNDMSEATRRILADTLQRLHSQMPEGVNADLPPMPMISQLIEKYGLSIDYGNLPLQAAVDFVGYLVNLESGRQKFVSGVPTVGGRTHIGVITRGEGFRMLNEPALTHHNVGFSREI